MNLILIVCFLAVLCAYAWLRPSWRRIGPSLLDSYVIGLSLFAVGSILVWAEDITYAEAVMRISVLSALSGMIGAMLWSFLFASRIAGLNFVADANRFTADPLDRFVISTGFVVCSLVSCALLVAVFSHEHVRSLLLSALAGSGGLNDARVIVSSGAEGYFAPGYVKQFRDIVVPVLGTAAIFCGASYRGRWLLYAALVIAIATTFVSGQRLVIIQYILCLGTAFLIDRFSSRSKFASLGAMIVLGLFLLGAVGAMTKMLGRLDAPPDPSTQVKEEHESTAKEKAEAVVRARSKDKLNADFSSFSPAVGIPVSLVYRAVIAVPRENTISYPLWAGREHTLGAGWLTDLASIRPGVQKQLSNELSWVNWSSRMGNSPLGLAPDVYHNSGWIGVMVVPALFALGFLWLDIALVASRSALTSAAKIFMFFSIPLMYSPFMFVLYGGFVALGILCYARLRQKGAFTFLEKRLPAGKLPV